MPTIHDCEKCTQECPQRQLAREHAEKRMYATHEFVALQKEIEAGNLTYIIHSHWMWNKYNGEVRCKNCKALVGVCFSETSLNELKNEQHYCYNCGAKMIQHVTKKYDDAVKCHECVDHDQELSPIGSGHCYRFDKQTSCDYSCGEGVRKETVDG